MLNRNNIKTIIILLLICALILMLPLALIRDSEFSGTDGKATEVIGELNPDYKPWADPVLEPPGGETESLLFCLQAALGAGVFGFALGTLRERKRKEDLTHAAD